MVQERIGLEGCALCELHTIEEQKIVLQNEHCLFLQTPQQVLVGSGLIVPIEHRETVFDMSEAEWKCTYTLLHEVKKLIDEEYSPDGYNVGWNCGEVGGQHIPHAHLHVIPRFRDEPYQGKGIRHWLKSEANKRSSQ